MKVNKVTVALLASLDLAKDGYVELIQNKDSNQLYLKLSNHEFIR